MRKITKSQYQDLRAKGLLKDKRTKHGHTVQEPNYTVANREHNSRDKSYYVVEERAIMNYLDNGYLPKWFKNKNSRNKPVKHYDK